METIERINNENIRLHDEMKDLRQTLVNHRSREREGCERLCLEKNGR